MTFTAEVTKTRASRTVPLPADLAARLNAVKGKTWLWERSVEDSKVFRPSPITAKRTEFSPDTWQWAIQNLFKEFNEGRAPKDQVRPHDLRARAFTLIASATGSADQTAAILGSDPQTARHYLDATKAFDREGMLRKLAGLLAGPAG